MKILTINNKKEKKILKQRVPDFDFSECEKKEIKKIVKEMREIMREKQGFGLSANQVGLSLRFFIAEFPFPKEKPKFYAIFNPEIVKEFKKKALVLEGCLSVPGIWGFVERAEKIILNGYNLDGKKIKIKAFGLLAEIFQHEIDHLNGILFTDKAKQTFNRIKNQSLYL